MRELKTQYRDISAMAPISVCRGITPLCTPAPLKEEFAAEVGGRYADRVYSLWQRLNLIFLEETAEPAVPEKKVTLVNQFTQQIFLQLLANKQTNRLIRSDRTYFAVAQAARKGSRSPVSSKHVTETAVKEMLAAFHEKHVLTGDLCGLASLLAGDTERDGIGAPSVQTLALAVSHLAKTVSEEKQISTQNRVLLERIHSAATVSGRIEEREYARELTTVVEKLLHAAPETVGEVGSPERRPSDEAILSHVATIATRARAQYTTAVEQVLRMVREHRAVSEIRETVNTVTNRLYDSRIQSLGYGRDYEDSAKRVRALLEAVVLSDTERRTAVYTDGSVGGTVGPYVDNHAPNPANGGRAEIIQQLGARLQALGSQKIRDILVQASEPAVADGEGTGDVASASVVTSESLKRARAVKTAEAVIAQILQAADGIARMARIPNPATSAEGRGDEASAVPRLPLVGGEPSVLTGDVTVSRALGYDVGRAPVDLTYGREDPSAEAAAGLLRPETEGRASGSTGIPGTALVRPFDGTPLHLQRTENVFYAQSVGQAADMTDARASAERRVIEKIAERVVDTVTDRMTDRTVERILERVPARGAESEAGAALRPRNMLAQRADMVQGLHRRAQKYLADSMAFENGHGMGYLPDGGAPAADFMHLLRAGAAHPTAGSVQAFQTLQMIYGDTAVSEPSRASASEGNVAVVRPVTHAPMYLQSTNNFYTYTLRSDGAQDPDAQTSTLPRGRVRTAVGGYGQPMRLVMPEIPTAQPSAEEAPRQSGNATDVRFGSVEGRPDQSYRKDLDEKTLRALDGLIAQATQSAQTTRSTQAGETNSAYPVRDGDSAERRGVVRAVPAVLPPEASLYYGEAGVDADEITAQGGMSILRPRRSAVLSDVSEMRMMLSQLNSTARIRRYSMRTTTERAHIANLIHRLESEETVTVTKGGEQPTTLGGGFTFRTVDDGENMIMLVPPVTADEFRAESGRLRELPPITHKEPAKAEMPPPAATTEKVTLNQKMESSRTVKAQVNKGFEDMSREDIAKLADKVYAQLEARLIRERRRSGF